MDLIDDDFFEHLSDEEFLLKNNFRLLSTSEERLWVGNVSQYFKNDIFERTSEKGRVIRLFLRSSRFEVGLFQIHEANFESVKATAINKFNIVSKLPGFFQQNTYSLLKRYKISDLDAVNPKLKQKLIELIPTHIELTINENKIMVYAYLLNEPREKLILITELIELF